MSPPISGAAEKDVPLHRQVIAITAFVSFNVGLNVFNSWALKKGHVCIIARTSLILHIAPPAMRRAGSPDGVPVAVARL